MRFPIILATVALAGCHSQPEVTAQNASVAETNAAATRAVRMQPGKWRIAVRVESLEMPGAPAQLQGILKQRTTSQSATVTESCVTREQAERPPEEVLGQGLGNCRYQSFAVKDGKLDAAMMCRGGPAGGGDVRTVLSGEFGATGYNLVAATEAEVAGQKTVSKTRLQGSRLGDCDGSEKG